MEFSRPDYWSGLPFPSPGDLPDPGLEPRSSALQVGSLLSEPPGKPSLLFSRKQESRNSCVLELVPHLEGGWPRTLIYIFCVSSMLHFS